MKTAERMLNADSTAVRSLYVTVMTMISFLLYRSAWSSLNGDGDRSVPKIISALTAILIVKNIFYFIFLSYYPSTNNFHYYFLSSLFATLHIHTNYAQHNPTVLKVTDSHGTDAFNASLSSSSRGLSFTKSNNQVRSQEFIKGGGKPDGSGDGSPQRGPGAEYGNPREPQRGRDKNWPIRWRGTCTHAPSGYAPVNNLSPTVSRWLNNTVINSRSFGLLFVHENITFEELLPADNEQYKVAVFVWVMWSTRTKYRQHSSSLHQPAHDTVQSITNLQQIGVDSSRRPAAKKTSNAQSY